MNVRAVLRGAAVGIAVAAFLDPSLSTEVEVRQPLTIVAVGAEALGPATRLRDRVGSGTSVEVFVHDGTSAAGACPSEGSCVIVSADDAPRHVTAGARVIATMQVTGGEPPLVKRVWAPSEIHRDAAAVLHVETTRPAERVRIFDGDVLIGSAEPSSTTTEVAWVPLAEGARVLRVVVDDESVDVGVRIATTPARVMFYEPQATWLGTFVRRALDDDTRFVVSGRSRLGPSVSVRRGGMDRDTGREMDRLDPTTLEEVSAVVVTSPASLSAADVNLLEQFVVERGGSLVVLTDQRPAGAVLRLLPRVVGERSHAEPQSIGLLRATEWLTFETATGVAAIAALDQQPIVVARALGRGRVIASGALDAWRFRYASDGFDTFWTTLVWDAAQVAGPRLRVQTDRVLASRGEEIRVVAETQGMSAPASTNVAASAYALCGSDRQFIRMWPGGRLGRFEGTLRVNAQSDCEIRVQSGDVASTTVVTIRDDIRRERKNTGNLEAIAAAHGGLFVTSGREDDVVSYLDEQLTSERQPIEYWPMRSALWLVPFAACLGAEWWLRRQSGLG